MMFTALIQISEHILHFFFVKLLLEDYTEILETCSVLPPYWLISPLRALRKTLIVNLVNEIDIYDSRERE
jgi:hypothetical protein